MTIKERDFLKSNPWLVEAPQKFGFALVFFFFTVLGNSELIVMMYIAFPSVLFYFALFFGYGLLSLFVLLTKKLEEEIFGERFSTQNNGRKY